MGDIRDFNATGWMAYFTGTETLMARQRDVDGWDPATGTALIVDAEQGARRLVTDYPDFSHLERTGRVIAALPGAGWRVRGLPWGDEPARVEEVVAWLVTSDGKLNAVAVQEDGAFGQVGDPQWCFPPQRDVGK